jgi:hydrogenase-1 operon protein HyaF
MQKINIPVNLIGAGSQPAEEEGASLDILELPGEMQTFRMPEMPDPQRLAQESAAMAVISGLHKALARQVESRLGQYETLELDGLDNADCELIDQLLGEGEVSMRFERDGCHARIQESVLAGVWRVKYYTPQGALSNDTIEVADVPKLCRRHVFKHAAHRAELNRDAIPPGVLNAPPLLAEINDKVVEYRPGHESHVINLTLLPQTEEDLGYLIERLGEGPLTILSRGYGNCRITSTAVQSVWWVQYFNSQDKNILNTLEIGGVPVVAAAAIEDLQDSRDRLAEMMEAYR